MRCPDCNKFVSFDQLDPEIESSIEGTEIVGTVRLVLACAECGGELKEANLDFQVDLEHTCEDENNDDSDLEIISEGGEVKDRYEGKGRRAKHFYGADLTFEVKCRDCEETFDVTTSVEEQASGFDELV
jgi:hypothetical protein